MRILYWTEAFLPHIGGVEILSDHLIQALRDRGYDFTVVTSHSNLNIDDRVLYKGIPVYRFHFQTSLYDKNLKQMKEILQRITELKKIFKPDLVHFHFSGPSIYFHLQTNTTHSVPTLVTIHNSPNYTIGHDSLLLLMLRSANWISTVSLKLLNDIRQLTPEIAPRSSVIYNALEMPESQTKQLPFDIPRLLCLGRVTSQKGFDLALTAFASLFGRFPQIRLTIAGEGPAKLDLEKQTDQLGIRDAVEFTGWVDHSKITDLINTTTVVVIPSRSGESLPLTALQAAQMARPVVATDVGALSEFVAHGETGLLVRDGDSGALAESIAYMLEHPGETVQMGKNARERVMSKFSMKQFVDAYDSLYQKLFKEFNQK